MDLVIIAIGLGLLAIVYGFVTSRQVLRASAGNEKMQEIAAAIQEGAQAYLGRQYRTIAMVGVVAAIVVGLAHRPDFGGRLRARRRAVGRGRLHRHEYFGARQRPHRGRRADRPADRA